jgi:asparagine synthetase B (glutamine-hydrolysing)
MAAVIGRFAAQASGSLNLDRSRAVEPEIGVRYHGLDVRYRGACAFVATGAVHVSLFIDGRILRLGDRTVGPESSRSAVAELLAREFMDCGQDLFPRLDGEFALTLIDHRASRVYLVRDRVGMRPLFWTRLRDGALAWASECKMLLPMLERRQLDATGLAEVLQFRWLAGDRTLYSGVNRILPGTSVVLERGDGGVSLSTRQFWRFHTDPEPADRPMEEWVDEAERALAAAVTSRTAEADNVAVLLSGGVDSPLLAHQVKRHCRRYSMISPTWRGFDDPEIPRAVEYGRLVGGDHRVVVMDPDCVEEEFLRLNRRFEQPARSPHALTLARVGAELDGFDLLLHGEGADALFGADHRVSSAS